jgi:mRNA-degrading endonuclease toxin of MazEF toxin-antitoxin module
MFFPEFFNSRSQDLEEAYQDAGQFYWKKSYCKSDDIFFGKDSIPIVIPRYLVQDIDTPEDWEMAEKLYQLAYPNKFDRWNQTKQQVHNKENLVGFKPREIFWVRLGQNIGDEEFGKGNEFQRPVLIVKKLTSNLFMGIPLTSKVKEENDFFHTISYTTKKGNMQNSLMLLQLKTFDKKRLMGKIGKLNTLQFEEVLQKVQKLFIP